MNCLKTIFLVSLLTSGRLHGADVSLTADPYATGGLFTRPPRAADPLPPNRRQ